MIYNNAMLIRRDLLARMCKLMFEGELKEKINRLPLEMVPRHSKNTRCCVHKERAVLKYSAMGILGFNVKDEEDEFMPLSEYVQMAEDRTEFTDVMLTVVDVACSSCVKINYVVTNLCRTCVGHPCTFACKKNAISIHGKAEINHDTCVNCGMCLDACPFNAIIYQPVPCEESCPVNAISKNENGIEYIDETKCIYCGRCLESCPFGAIIEKTYLVQITNALKSGKRVKAMLAPALLGQFQDDPEKIIAAIKQIGFDEVIEVAKGANETTRNETLEFEERMEQGQPFMTTSCCHSYTRLVEKNLPDLKPFVSDTKTPAYYTAEMIKKEDPDCVVVFIVPCVSKRHESYYNPNIDYAMSFEELGAMLVAKQIEISKCEDATCDTTIHASGRGFCYSGGVADSVKQFAKHPEKIKEILIDGIDKSTLRMLRQLPQNHGDANFVEVMMCKGGCVNGCDTLVNSKIALRQVKKVVK